MTRRFSVHHVFQQKFAVLVLRLFPGGGDDRYHQHLQKTYFFAYKCFFYYFLMCFHLFSSFITLSLTFSTCSQSPNTLMNSNPWHTCILMLLLYKSLQRLPTSFSELINTYCNHIFKDIFESQFLEIIQVTTVVRELLCMTKVLERGAQ